MDRINLLNNNKAGLFHTKVDRVFFLCKRSRPEIHLNIVVLCTRLKQSNQGDWSKLLRLVKYPVGTQELCLTLKADKTSCLKLFLDTAFTVHSSFKLHTRETLTMEK